MSSVFVSLKEQMAIVRGEVDADTIAEEIIGVGKTPLLLHKTSEDEKLVALRVTDVDLDAEEDLKTSIAVRRPLAQHIDSVPMTVQSKYLQNLTYGNYCA